MTLKIRIPRPLFFGSRAGLTPLAAGTAGQGATFHATLADCMDDWVVRESSRPAATTAKRSIERKPRKEATPGAIPRVVSWLQSRVAIKTVKRLRVAETVSLGEKRFVALVSVEGREFLIGGGSSGVSLLTALDSAARSGAELDDAEDGE
jgi:Flagellar biosynthesis protein, FliO